MKKLILFVAVQAFCFAKLVAQNQTDKEIQAVVSNLITQLNGKKSVKKIIILDFTDTEGGANKLGNYLTEELSIAMSSVPKNFSISDKSILAKGTVTSKSPNNVATTTGQVINQANQTAVKNNLITSEKAATTQAVGDAVTLLGNLNIFKKSTNKLKGIDAVVMGTLSEYQSNFRLVVKVLDINNDNEIIAQGKGDFVKTKSFVEMWSEKIAKTNGSGGLLGGAANGDAMQIFKKDNLKFELMECYQSGQTFECVFQITNEGNDDLNLNVYNRESRAINAQSGYEYNVATIKLADKINSNEVSKTLIANSPIKAILSFDMKGGTVENLSKIEVKCWADKIGYFHAEMRNVQVK